MKDPNLPHGNRDSVDPLESAENAALDDVIIGKAFKGSLAVLVVLVIGGLSVWYLMKQPAKVPPPKLTQLKPPVKQAEQLADKAPKIQFTDITSNSGIAFVHCNGAYGDKLLPETMGGGVAFLDFNNDGWQDLLMVNSTYWPWDSRHTNISKPTMALYQNLGKGQFRDVTKGSGLDVSFYGMGVAVGDFDNDEKDDVFISGIGGGRLFQNQGGGKFIEVTTAAGVGGLPEDWSTACAWFDYDHDGRLDLFVANYVKWSKSVDFEVGYKLTGVGRAYGQPFNFEGAFPHLYHNEGGGKFGEVTGVAGLQIRNPATGVPVAKTLGISPVDLDGDGWMDLVIANDTVQNFVFHNQKNGTFKEIGALTGIAFDSSGLTRGAMGIDVARYRDDNALGIAISNFANEMTALYVSQKDPLCFVDEAIPEGVGPVSRSLLKFGLFFFDYDLDGRLDLLTANGHVEEEITKIQASQTYAQPAQLFWNSGAANGASFIAVNSSKVGGDIFKPIVGRGSAYADIDHDGDLDVIMTQIGGPPLLLRNDQQLGHHWVCLKLVGTKCNRDAVGAWISIRIGDRSIWRQVMPTRSYLSQSEIPVLIGLGKADRIDECKIIWPGNHQQLVPRLNMDGLTIIEQE